MTARRLSLLPFLVALAAFPTRAWAHAGHGLGGAADGLLHPFTGLDHLLAMVTVGVWAVQVGGRAVGQLPTAFLSGMLVGGVVAILGIHLPGAEAGILFSVLVLGLMVAMAAKPNLAFGLGCVGLFAVCHGYAHLAEMPAGAGQLRYGLGCLFGTALLHAAGVTAGLLLTRPGAFEAAGSRLLRVGGAAVALGAVAIGLELV